jgi:hypothetical protein
VPLAGDFDGPLVANPALSVADLAVTEGSSGPRTASFTVRLAPTSTGTVTVNYATANGTATAGSDYTSASGSLTFTAGQSTRTVSVTLNGDTTPESNETVFLNLSAPDGAALADNQAEATILDDDATGYFPRTPARPALAARRRCPPAAPGPSPWWACAGCRRRPRWWLST